MVSGHRYSSHALVLLAMLFVVGCFTAVSVVSLAADSSTHPFAVAPTELVLRLDELARIAPAKRSTTALDAEVIRFLERTYAGETLDERATIDAYLIGSEVFDAGQRETYARKLEDIISAARKATAAVKTPTEKGDTLLKFLHAGPMKSGYDADQTRLSTLLDTGKFNCVSATALYQIVARRLELDVHALSIPGGALAGHAMTFLVDGERRIDVETTNPDGFDFQSKVKQSGATVIGIQLDPKEGHEVSDLGLASLIAMNLACDRGRGDVKDPLAALQAALVGLALDPSENAAANNFVAALNDWAMQLGESKHYEDALRVMRFGFELLPAHETLKNNAAILWNRYASFEVKEGRAAEALAVIRRGVESGQLEKTDELEAAPFVQVADELAKAKKWSEAVAVLDQGLLAVDDASKAELREWLVQVHRQWSESHRKDGKLDAAIDVLSQLVKLVGEDPDAKNAVAYFAQESLGQIENAEGPAAAADLLARLRKRFAGIDYLDEAGKVCARKALDKLLRAKKYDEALAALDRYQPLLADDQARVELGGLIYDQWGRELVRQQQFERAVKVYGDGREQFRASELLENNVVVAWDSWAAEAMKRKDWREAIRIYELAVEAVGDNAHIRHNLEVCRSKLK